MIPAPEGFEEWPIALATPEEWAAMKGVEILDADGWRGPAGRDYSEAISETEFVDRLRVSTIRTLRRSGFEVDEAGVASALWG